MGKIVYHPEDGPGLQRRGTAMVKRPNPVYMTQVPTPFQVVTNEGPLGANAGDYVAYDPISGHVWPVQAAYLEQHYEALTS